MSKSNPYRLIVVFACGALLGVAAILLAQSLKINGSESDKRRLLDLSGLIWLEGDTFLAISDAKNPDESTFNRVSILTLPESLDGVGFEPINMEFPGGPSSDMESAAKIPGTSFLLFCESADDDANLQRIFLAEIDDKKRLEIRDVVNWDSFTEAYNIEATATSGSDGNRLFFWAERNQGKQGTDIKWSPLILEPFNIGKSIGSVHFELPESLVSSDGTPLYNRSIVAMDIDQSGRMYIAATLDPEGISPNPDDGPWRSIVYSIGTVSESGLTLSDAPEQIAVVDGSKIESIAIRPNGDASEIFIGTDDENFGGVLRQIIEP